MRDISRRKAEEHEIDSMSLLEQAAYRRGMVDMARAFDRLVRHKAPFDIIANLADKTANYSAVDDTCAVEHLLEESCRAYRFFDLVDVPDWIAPETVDIEGTPILAAYIESHRGKRHRLQVWCKHCYRWHYHSAGQRRGAGDGHRVAHCHDKESPYAATGYIIREKRRPGRNTKSKSASGRRFSL